MHAADLFGAPVLHQMQPQKGMSVATPARSEAMGVEDLFGGSDRSDVTPARSASPIQQLPTDTASGGRKDSPGVAEIPHAGTTPEYGSLTAAAEHQLYQSDYGAWCAYVAVAAGQKLLRGGPNAIRTAWQVMTDDYKAAVWKTLNPAERATFRAALDQRDAA